VALLLDALALSLTVWAVQSARTGEPGGAPRAAAHLCVLGSVLAQASTSYQGLSGQPGGVTSAVLHCIPPLVLCLALELIAWHHLAIARVRRAPERAQAVLREQVARAATGSPVDERTCAKAVIAAAKAGVVDVRTLATLVPAGDLEGVTALRALCGVVAGTGLAPVAVATQGVALDDDQADHDRSAIDQADRRADRRLAVTALHRAGRTTRQIAEELGCSTSTVSADLRAARRVPVGFTAPAPAVTE
jgi:DNA-binding NarL/FixJ family response regulator